MSLQTRILLMRLVVCGYPAERGMGCRDKSQTCTYRLPPEESAFPHASNGTQAEGTTHFPDGRNTIPTPIRYA